MIEHFLVIIILKISNQMYVNTIKFTINSQLITGGLLYVQVFLIALKYM